MEEYTDRGPLYWHMSCVDDNEQLQEMFDEVGNTCRQIEEDLEAEIY